jgi:NAD(P)-dependent dehydrogenase (short-subunit alcohol dehydrogenase family)
VVEITAAGGTARSLALDLADRASILDCISAAGPIDILINNAGVTNSKPVLDQSVDDWCSIIDVNLTGSFLAAVEAAKGMKSSKRGGSIINIASILGVRQGGHVTPYAVSKAALIQMTKQLALELARFDIRVNALLPGYFETELNQEFFATDAGRALIKRVPQRRLGKLEDLNGPILLLCSDASRFMTGAAIAVDGGHLVSSL